MTNEEISLSTERKLADSLKSKMSQKPFSKITISEITNDCHVNRNTFYYHFEDTYALLKWMMEQDAYEVIKHMNLHSDTEGAIRYVLNYIDKNRRLFCSAYESLGRNQLKEFFYTDMKAIVDANVEELDKSNKIRMNDEKKEFVALFFTDGIAGLLLEYVHNPKHRTRNEWIGHTAELFRCFRSCLEK